MTKEKRVQHNTLFDNERQVNILSSYEMPDI